MKKGIFFKQVFLQGIIAALLVLLTSGLFAQTTSSGVSSDGRDFYIGMVFPSYNKVAAPGVEAFFGTYALISSYESGAPSTKVHVSYFDAKTGVETSGQTFVVPARTGIQVPLDSLHMRLNDAGDVAEFKSCHIIADATVNVQFFSTGACSGGSYLALATPALGKRYVIASYGGNAGELGITCGAPPPLQIDSSFGFFEIIAPFDSTHILITPNAPTMGGHPGFTYGAGHTSPVEQPYSVTLLRGQCYFVKSSLTDADMSGSIVTSDKPVAVLGGHENAAIGGVTNRQLEGRDYMVEQMIPVDFWDTTGYVSIPLKDSQPNDPNAFEGVGEDYRVFSWDKTPAKINFYDGCIGAPFDKSTSRLAAPASERDGVTCPVDIEGTNGIKFSVMMYDKRNFATTAPFPAPSMMTIIPISHWRTSYLWYVPANIFESLQGYYVDVIGLDPDFISGPNGIQASYNGGPIRPIKQVLGLEQQWKGLPNHPEFTGVRFKLHPGSYYAHGAHPFMIYNFGFRGIAPNFTLGDFNCDNYFFSYANPVGASLSSGDSAKFGVTIDSLCGKWHICAHDQRTNDAGIRSISLLNDPRGDEFTPGMKSVNCHLDPSLDINGIGEADFPGTNSSVCFDVLVSRPIDSAFAAVLITDNAGNLKVIELRYAPAKFSLSPSASPITFPNLSIGSDTCFVVRLRNTALLPQNIGSASLDTAHGFSLRSVTPSLPQSLKPGDSITMKVCFAPNVNGAFTDTLKVVLDCLTLPIQLTGSAGTGLISATDIDFGKIDSGKNATHQVLITNIGTKPFILTQNWTISGSNAFSLISPILPVSLGVNASQNITVKYSPRSIGKDTAIIHWATDIGPPFTQSVKSFSVLTGEGIAATSSVPQPSPAPTLSLRPNPAGGSSIILTIGSAEAENAEVVIFDLLGREIYKKNILSPQLEIPIGNLQNGIYYARVQVAGKILMKKFEVLR